MTDIQIIPSGGSVELAPQASGFAHGFGIFETMKLSAGRLCFWEAHWARFMRSAEALGLELTCDAHAVFAAIRGLVALENLGDGTIKLSLIKGAEGSQLFVYSRPAIPAPDTVRLKLDLSFPLNQRSVLAGHKTHNYMENMLLLERCRAEGIYDLIRVNLDGKLAETTMANLFFLVDGEFCTPAIETGLLPGVIRQAVIDLADVREGLFDADILEKAEAVFLTNSSCGILPVSEIDGRSYASEAKVLALKKELEVFESTHAKTV